MNNSIKFPFFGAAYLLITSVLVKFSSVLVTSLIVLNFDTKVYGEYSYILNTSLLLATISSMSVHQLLVRNIASFKIKIPLFSYFCSLLLLYFIFGGGFLIFSSIFSNEFISENRVLIFLIGGSECLNLSLYSVLNGRERFKDLLVTKVIFSLILISSFILIKEVFNYISPVIYLLSSVLSNILILIKLKFKFNFNLNLLFKKYEFKVIHLYNFYLFYIKPSFPILLSGLMVTPIQWFMINKMANNTGFQEVGIFNLSIQFRMVIIMITSSISTALLPIFSRNSDGHKVNKMFELGLFFTLLIGVAITIITYILIEPILSFFDLSFSEKLLKIILLSMSGGVILSCFNIFAQKLLSEGRTLSILILNSSWGCCLMLLIFLYGNLDSYSASAYIFISYLFLLFTTFIYYYFFYKKI